MRSTIIAMHFFNVNLSKYILKKELTKLNTIIYKILIITSSKSLIRLEILTAVKPVISQGTEWDEFIVIL